MREALKGTTMAKIENKVAVKISPEANQNCKVLAVQSKVIVGMEKDLGKAVQTHMENIMMHVIMYRDARPALQFLQPLARADKHGKRSSILRTNAIQSWLQTYAFARISEDKVTHKLSVKTATKSLDKLNTPELINQHVKNAKGMVWNKVVTEPNYPSFDLFARVEALVKLAQEKALDKSVNPKTGKPLNIVTADQIKVLKDTLANLKIETVTAQ